MRRYRKVEDFDSLGMGWEIRRRYRHWQLRREGPRDRRRKSKHVRATCIATHKKLGYIEIVRRIIEYILMGKESQEVGNHVTLEDLAERAWQRAMELHDSALTNNLALVKGIITGIIAL
jgi:hypothetical protein